MIQYLKKLNSIVRHCENFKKDTLDFVFLDSEQPINPYYIWTPRYHDYYVVLEGIAKISDMLGIDYMDENIANLNRRVTYLNNPNSVNTKFRFIMHTDWIIKLFSQVEKELKNKLSLLSVEEKRRLNEAINCHIQGCSYSTVAMAVSAIESKLYSIMMKKCPNPELDTLTLGQLIREYLTNEDKYEKCIPKKHKPLLEYCNVYRVFSVHPKKEKITRVMSTSILNMAFGFLLDEELKSETE